MDGRRIRGLDGLRALAVALVVVNHNFYSSLHLLTGGAGVRLFFVLSGFLIISILHRRRRAIEERGTTLGLEIRHFYENRLYRIWPVYYLTIALVAVLYLLRGEFDPLSFIANIAFSGNIAMAHVWFEWRQVGVFWSVAVEEQFYLWAGLAFLLTNSAWHKRICIATLIVSVVWSAMTMTLLSPGDARFSIDVGSVSNFGNIALGGLAALALKPTRLLGLAAYPALALYVLGAVTGFPAWVSGGLFLAPALLVPIILVGVAGNQDGYLVRMLDLAPLRYIGRISYGIYLFHSFVHLDLLPGPTLLRDHVTYKAIVETGLAVAAAAASWRWFEKPILDRRDRRRARAAEERAVRETVAV